jgi:hypothetical protein
MLAHIKSTQAHARPVSKVRILVSLTLQAVQSVPKANILKSMALQHAKIVLRASFQQQFQQHHQNSVKTVQQVDILQLPD